MTTALLGRVRKALESVPWKCEQCGVTLPDPCIQRLVSPGIHPVRPIPDYHALAAKIAPLLEALEDSKRGFLRMAIVALYTPTACKNQAAKIDEVLATWRTEGST